MLNARAFVVDDGQRTMTREQSEIGEAAVDGLRDDIRDGASFGKLGQGIVDLIADMDEVSLFTYRRYIRPLGAVNAYSLMCHLEQAPNPSSRVTLGEERDALGLPRLQLNWQFGEIERHTFTRLCELIGEACGEVGLGRVRMLALDPETGYPPGTRGAWHQMGTTRMSAEPRNGVVDTNCRLHDVENRSVTAT
jgi:choline dehydrogenase-like flavoprotein